MMSARRTLESAIAPLSTRLLGNARMWKRSWYVLCMSHVKASSSQPKTLPNHVMKLSAQSPSGIRG